MASDGHLWMGCQVVQHAVVFLDGVDSSFCLLRAEVIGHVEDGWVNCLAIIQELANALL